MSKTGRSDTLVARFWAKVVKGDGCWSWTGRPVNGYGQIDGRGAHCVAWEIDHKQPVPAGLVVCHKCDNPLCVNPSHLVAATQAANMSDKIAKGRDVRGERVNTARLTREQVEAIRREHADGATQIALAQKYGVGQPHISTIVRGKAWGPGRGGRWEILDMEARRQGSLMNAPETNDGAGDLLHPRLALSVLLTAGQRPRSALLVACLMGAVARWVPDILRRRDLAAALVQGLAGLDGDEELEELPEAARAIVAARTEALWLDDDQAGCVWLAMVSAWRTVTT